MNFITEFGHISWWEGLFYAAVLSFSIWTLFVGYKEVKRNESFWIVYAYVGGCSFVTSIGMAFMCIVWIYQLIYK